MHRSLCYSDSFVYIMWHSTLRVMNMGWTVGHFFFWKDIQSTIMYKSKQFSSNIWHEHTCLYMCKSQRQFHKLVIYCTKVSLACYFLGLVPVCFSSQSQHYSDSEPSIFRWPYKYVNLFVHVIISYLQGQLVLVWLLTMFSYVISN